MKKILIFLTGAVLSLALLGCDSMFENETPPHELSGTNAITDQSSAENALNGIYGHLQGFGPMSANYIADNEFRSGLLYGVYRGSFDERELINFDIPVTSSYISSGWDQIFQLINAANNFIYYVEALPDSKFATGKRIQMLAEAHFMRAFGHLYVLRRYGFFWDTTSKLGALVRMVPSALSNNAQARETVARSYELIFQDFDYAIQNGPQFYSRFRSCATTAKAFKADALMNRGTKEDYIEAARLAQEVIKSSEFALETKYEDVFANGYDSKELLITRHIKTPPESIDFNTSTIFKMFCGNGTYKPTDLYKLIMTPDDKRYATTLMNWEFTGSNGKYTELIWKKHYVSNGDCPMWYMRVAQMYLIRAEALWNTEASAQSIIDELNVLRHRSGNPEFKSSDFETRQELLEEIFYENVREIGMENGALYYLLIRMRDSSGERMLKTYNPNFTKDSQLCFPIPDSEIKYNSLIEQKPL